MLYHDDPKSPRKKVTNQGEYPFYSTERPMTGGCWWYHIHPMADHCTLDPFSDVLLASLTLDLRWSVISLTPQAVPITVAYYFYGHRSPRSLTKYCNKQTTHSISLTLLLFSTTSTQSTYTILKILKPVKMVLWLYGVLKFSVWSHKFIS